MEKEHVKAVLTKEIATELSMSPGEIDDQASFMKLGISSVQALKIINRLRKELDIDINPVALFEFKTIEDISNYLVEEEED
ncbi:acyl carrier protein [Stackebrandtia endophytica]|uniref:Acyl carrier protein n=1 Tax=Stackebrandtia endophytica TaxID=1496996 RepID=A0A543AVY3_9ACTN|nr:acyl carrier protein [Stackebrandtia endophytica]TQL76701.1 acyl carrier protein [Stackebrandtia endophytica]